MASSIFYDLRSYKRALVVSSFDGHQLSDDSAVYSSLKDARTALVDKEFHYLLFLDLAEDGGSDLKRFILACKAHPKLSAIPCYAAPALLTVFDLGGSVSALDAPPAVKGEKPGIDNLELASSTPSPQASTVASTEPSSESSEIPAPQVPESEQTPEERGGEQTEQSPPSADPASLDFTELSFDADDLDTSPAPTAENLEDETKSDPTSSAASVMQPESPVTTSSLPVQYQEQDTSFQEVFSKLKHLTAKVLVTIEDDYQHGDVALADMKDRYLDLLEREMKRGF